MKVGIVTYNRKNNYGDLLSTYALKTYLENLKLQVEVFHYNTEPKMKKKTKTNNRVLRKMKRIFLRIEKKLIPENKEKTIQKENKSLRFQEGVLNFTKPYLKLSSLQKNHAIDHDVLIAGPNQIWDMKVTNGFDPFYFLEFGKKSARRVAYAVGLGQNIPPGYFELYNRYIKNFDFVSVYEEKMIDIFSGMTKRNIVRTINPILLLEKEEFDRLKEESKFKNEEYLYVHFHHCEQRFIQIANKTSETMHLKIVHNQQKGLCKNELAYEYHENPERFISLIENAKLVLTDSLEILSLAFLYKKKILAFDEDILTEFNGLDKKKQASIDFLNTALFGEIPDRKKDNYFQTAINYNCYGCTLCKDICPTKAIEMEEDREGFIYPKVNHEICNQCGACEKKCIFQNAKWIEKNNDYPKVYAIVNKNQEDYMQSSSGGAFSALYRPVISMQGVVVGVAYNENMEAEYTVANTLEECEKLRGSKYVTPQVNDIKPKVKKLLDEKKPVLFTGNPCQLAGLRSYLGKEYDHLFLVEIICHAVPSPKVFRKYIAYLNEKYHSKVIDFKFRSKSDGWGGVKEHCTVIFKDGLELTETKSHNNYYKIFHGDYIQRPSCYNCEFASYDSVADITIGDYWGINKIMPKVYDENKKGISVIIINTNKGMELFKEAEKNLLVYESNVYDAYKSNHVSPRKLKKERHEFMERLDEENINELLERYNPYKNKPTSDKEIIRKGL